MRLRADFEGWSTLAFLEGDAYADGGADGAVRYDVLNYVFCVDFQ